MDFLQILQMNILLDVINNGEEKTAANRINGDTSEEKIIFHFYGKCQRQSN